MNPANTFPPPFVRSFGLCAALLLGLVLSGCATSEYKYTTKISSGERLSFRLVNGRVDDAVADGFEARAPVILPGEKEKKLQFAFGVVAKNKPPRRVQVEDVSEEQPMLLVDDTDPQLKGQLWTGQSAWFDLEDPQAHWISYLGETFRVYRITITTADGATVVLHEGSVTPAFMKAMMRKFFGKEY
ncbi:hypothetical protein [Opitutus terrae]|uniref:Uncharacterized protein n=1 Tax=Opitutus terrae (strain DSM 11246 / JCM 15787 / PB90-1) TaxID=452637 RepID=B1ZVV1_OPITP|nr:hypothetical protein [Opitutus terrae]ACB75037.1 hypothetical protein Oter_1753 [Opitutus terrae PB90-1]